jgi:hypothetical protein
VFECICVMGMACNLRGYQWFIPIIWTTYFVIIQQDRIIHFLTLSSIISARLSQWHMNLTHWETSVNWSNWCSSLISVRSICMKKCIDRIKWIIWWLMLKDKFTSVTWWLTWVEDLKECNTFYMIVVYAIGICCCYETMINPQCTLSVHNPSSYIFHD